MTGTVSDLREACCFQVLTACCSRLLTAGTSGTCGLVKLNETLAQHQRPRDPDANSSAPPETPLPEEVSLRVDPSWPDSGGSAG